MNAPPRGPSPGWTDAQQRAADSIRLMANEERNSRMSQRPELVGVDHITVTVRDVDRAKRFYEEILGLQVKTDVRVDGVTTFGGFAVQDGEVVELATASEGAIYDGTHEVRRMVIFERVGGTSLTLIGHPGDELGGRPSEKLDRLGYTHLAFDVRDMEGFFERARSLGVEAAAPGFLQDPDGNLIQFQEVGQSDRIHQLYRDRYLTSS
jgi:catechol 2,3-dioxygenase-like lactoylglutathione lyase family enzyme